MLYLCMIGVVVVVIYALFAASPLDLGYRLEENADDGLLKETWRKV